MINIGPFSITRRGSVALKAAPVQTGEIGRATGTSGYGRRGPVLALSEVDYLEAMQPPTRWTTVAKMLSDDAVGAAYRAATLPILAASLDVEPGTDDDVGREVADFVRADLTGMTVALLRHRREVLGYLAEGVRVFEKVFEVREDGLIHLRKLALRPNASITEWQVDEHGGPVGVIQLDSGAREVELEIARLLVFTNEGEGSNLVGRSVFRAAYKPWWYKDKLERIAYIGAERGAVGVPVGTQTGEDDDVADQIESILQGIRAHESGFVRENDRFKFRIEGLSGSRVDPLPLLQDFRRGVFVSVLADFLALGSSSTGSFALSRDKSSFFVMALGAVIQDMEDTYNRHLIAPWVRANFGDVPTASLPRIVHGPLNTRDVGEWFGALNGAVTSGVIPTDESINEMARDVLGIPRPPVVEEAPGDVSADAPVEATLLNGIQIQSALDIIGRYSRGELSYVQAETALLGFLAIKPNLISRLLGGNTPAGAGPEPAAPDGVALPGVTEEEANTSDQPNEGGDDTAAPGVNVQQAAATPPRLESLVKIEALGISVRFTETGGALDRGEARMVERLTKLQEKQAKRLAARAAKIVKDGDWAKLAEEKVPSDEEAAVIAEEMGALYDFGSEEYGRELASQDVKPAPVEGEQSAGSKILLGAFAAYAGARLADRMLSALGAGIFGPARQDGKVDAGTLAGFLTDGVGKLAADLARQAASTALGQGRADAAAANADKVKTEIYSTALDESVCQYCKDYEGTEWDIGDGPQVPNPECMGKDRCRCQRIPVAA